jgi:MYXO-CTERM domain-containing protein
MRKFLLLALAATLGCAPPPTVGQTNEPIINGTADTGDPSVMLVITSVTSQQGKIGLCTATVISPHVLLTAAHCLDPAEFATDMGAPTLAFHVFTQPVIDLTKTIPPADLLAVKDVYFDPQFNPDPNVFVQNGHDVGVVVLVAATTQTPIPFNHTPPAQTLVGTNARVIGYGESDPTNVNTAGTKRQAMIGISGIDNLYVNFHDGAHGICEGDSGGPALVPVNNGVETIFGITAFGVQGCPLTVPSSDTRVDLYASWIDGYVQMFDPGFNTMPGQGGGGSGGTGGGGGGGSGTDGGTGATGHGTSGGCSVGGAAQSAPAALLLLAALALVRRRRARP